MDRHTTECVLLGDCGLGMTLALGFAAPKIPKWMVFVREIPMKMDENWGEPYFRKPPSGETNRWSPWWYSHDDDVKVVKVDSFQSHSLGMSSAVWVHVRRSYGWAYCVFSIFLLQFTSWIWFCMQLPHARMENHMIIECLSFLRSLQGKWAL